MRRFVLDASVVIKWLFQERKEEADFDTLYHAVALISPETLLITADSRYHRKARHLGNIMLLKEFLVS